MVDVPSGTTPPKPAKVQQELSSLARITLGAIGALLPIILVIVTMDLDVVGRGLQTIIRHDLSDPTTLGILVRYPLLMVIGAVSVYCFKTEGDMRRALLVGASAPAMLTTFFAHGGTLKIADAEIGFIGTSYGANDTLTPPPPMEAPSPPSPLMLTHPPSLPGAPYCVPVTGKAEQFFARTLVNAPKKYTATIVSNPSRPFKTVPDADQFGRSTLENSGFFTSYAVQPLQKGYVVSFVGAPYLEEAMQSRKFSYPNISLYGAPLTGPDANPLGSVIFVQPSMADSFVHQFSLPACR